MWQQYTTKTLIRDSYIEKNGQLVPSGIDVLEDRISTYTEEFIGHLLFHNKHIICIYRRSNFSNIFCKEAVRNAPRGFCKEGGDVINILPPLTDSSYKRSGGHYNGMARVARHVQR